MLIKTFIAKKLLCFLNEILQNSCKNAGKSCHYFVIKKNTIFKKLKTNFLPIKINLSLTRLKTQNASQYFFCTLCHKKQSSRYNTIIHKIKERNLS